MRDWTQLFMFALLFMIYWRADSGSGFRPSMTGAWAFISALSLTFAGICLMWGDLVR